MALIALALWLVKGQAPAYGLILRPEVSVATGGGRSGALEEVVAGGFYGIVEHEIIRRVVFNVDGDLTARTRIEVNDVVLATSFDEHAFAVAGGIGLDQVDSVVAGVDDMHTIGPGGDGERRVAARAGDVVRIALYGITSAARD